jgi:branched-chain amino acid transport system substrate-binding protein
VVRMVYTENVWAVVGGIDGPSTHLAEQVVAKARVTLMSPASTDKTVNLANVPWMFSLAPGDHLQAPQLAQAIAESVGQKSLVLVSADDHDSHLFTVELEKCLAAREIVPRYHFQCKQTATDLAELVNRVIGSDPSGVGVIAGPDHSARLVLALREAGFKGTVFGGPAMGRQAFRQRAGTAADGVLFPLLSNLDEAEDGFPIAFENRFGHLPDYATLNTYDAVRLLVAAIHTAGLNRVRIRDALANRSPWPGAAGTVQWDPLGSNTRPVPLGTIHNGRLTPVHKKPAG